MNRAGVSVVVPVTERFADPARLFDEYRTALESVGLALQFIFVLDGPFRNDRDKFLELESRGHELDVVTLSRTFGESAALTVGFNRARYELVMTLPAYKQVQPECLPRLFEAIEDKDMVIARRWPRQDSGFNRFSAGIFHALLRSTTHVAYRDLGCGVRLIRRSLLREVTIYGDQHRFFPILADRRGFRVAEVDIPQATEESGLRVYRPGVYVSRLLDLLGVFFVVRFTKKPLRFFGTVGSALLALGGIIMLVAVLQRLLLDVPLADRPLLLAGSLLLVIGVQLFGLGLIGELVIFTHASEQREYAVAETVNLEEKSPAEKTVTAERVRSV